MPTSDPPSSVEGTTSPDPGFGGEAEGVAHAKAALRRTLRARRRAVADSQGSVLAMRVALHVLALDLWFPGCGVAGSWPVRGELDPRPLMAALHGRGCRVALPVIVGTGQPLRFRAWAPDDPLEPGPFSTVHPAATAPEVWPDRILLPLVGFDDAGRRLGQGGGYYDRTLAALAERAPDGRGPVCLGLAFAAQRVDVVPSADHDRRLDAVATEEGVRWFTAPPRA